MAEAAKRKPDLVIDRSRRRRMDRRLVAAIVALGLAIAAVAVATC
jgi:hypothetical protein